MPRLIYIHGYVEDATIFDKLAPLLPEEAVLKLTIQDEFARWNPDDRTVNVTTLAQYLAKTYQIGPEDVIIGHSMGGWIAANLKAQTGCRAILVSSYTNKKKIVLPVRNITIVRMLVRLGVVQSRWVTNFALKMYPFDESRALHKTLVGNLLSQPRRYVYQQLRVLLAPHPIPPAQPDVRIHARPDSVLRYPDEPFHEVPGDHFSLVFHPESVATPILVWLKVFVSAKS